MSTGAGEGLLLTDAQEALRSTVERFAHEEVAPVIGDFYEREEFPYAIVARMGEMGLFGLPFPSEYGGRGMRLHRAVPRHRGTCTRRFVGGDHAVSGRSARDHAALPFRDRATKTALAAPLVPRVNSWPPSG